jgi:3-phosphoshikimate 1-carboxyvinyltransferase
MTATRSRPAHALSGTIQVPGDKSVSHRALILAASAVGESRIAGLLEADDVMRTADALRCLGAEITRYGDGWRVFGRGVGGLCEADRVLDMGNSGTGARLLMGLVASHPFITFFCGDSSLQARPMRRVMDPLQEVGAAFISRSGGRLPLAVRGTADPLPIVYTLPVASAQVKSAILLAALNAPGETTVIEPEPTRDHSERMLAHFGANLRIEDRPDGSRSITLTGQPELSGREVRVPGDLSSAAFPLVAGLIVPGSRLQITGVGLNRLRTGLLETLREMGAELAIANERMVNGEPVADLQVSASALQGVSVPAERVPRMIDEFPILAAAAATASGTTHMSGLAELRVKESDRLTAMAQGLAACGVAVEAGDDWLSVNGAGGPVPGGATIAVHLDHRIAMSFLVLGMASRHGIAVDDAGPIATSFPLFVEMMNRLGAAIETPAS